MKYKLGCICLTMLLALQLCTPASAAMETNELWEDTDTIALEQEVNDKSLQEEYALASPEEGAFDSDLELTSWIEPQTGESGIFQEGAFFGPQTIPGQAILMDVSEHPEYSAAERRLYQEIEVGLQDHADSISITPFPRASQDRLVEIYYQVVNDHPELFYCRTGLGWSISSTSIVAIRPQYLYSADESREKTAELDRCVSDALAQIEGITDPLEKVLTLHDYLAVTCKYAQPIPASPSPVYSAYGALVDQEAVCQGYALAFKLLMNRIGVPCVLVPGAQSMNHVWNAVQLDGNWYHVDVTWDDPIPNKEGYSGHLYFLRSNAKMLTEGTGSGCHYGWDTNIVSPWGGSEYDSGWIFNETVAPLYRWNGSYYYIDAPYANRSHVYKADTLRAPGTLVRENLDRDYSCGPVWYNDRLYYIPYTSSSTLNVMALDLTKGQTVRLGEFTRNGNEAVGLRYENGGITVVRAGTEAKLGQSYPLLDWVEFKSSYRTYGLSEDGNYLLLDRYALNQVNNAMGKTLWIATYNGSGRMTFVGSASSFPSIANETIDLQMIPFQSHGTPVTDQIKMFFLDPTTFTP